MSVVAEHSEFRRTSKCSGSSLIPAKPHQSPPTSFLIKRAAGIEKGSTNANSIKVGTVTRKQLREIADVKRPDMNIKTLRSLGVDPVMTRGTVLRQRNAASKQDQAAGPLRLRSGQA